MAPTQRVTEHPKPLSVSLRLSPFVSPDTRLVESIHDDTQERARRLDRLARQCWCDRLCFQLMTLGGLSRLTLMRIRIVVGFALNIADVVTDIALFVVWFVCPLWRVHVESSRGTGGCVGNSGTC